MTVKRSSPRKWEWSCSRRSGGFLPRTFKLDDTLRLVGSHKVLESIRAGESPARIWYDWQEDVERFKKVRAQYLLYP